MRSNLPVLIEAMKSAQADRCLEWTHTRDGNGYGRLTYEGRVQPAHRVAFTLYYNVEIAVIDILHRCDNPPCFNPLHLFVGDQVANNADMVAKGRNRTARGSSNPTAKLTEKLVLEIRALDQGISRSAIALRFGVSKSLVNAICWRKAWPHVE